MFIFYLLSGVLGYGWRYWRMRRVLIRSFKLKKGEQQEKIC
jgi:hypothetical protein